MPKFTRGTVLRFTYEHELGAPTGFEDNSAIYLGDVYIELGTGSVFNHIEVVSTPEPEWQAGDIARDANGVTWCRSAGVGRDLWYLVHNHPGTIGPLYSSSEEKAYNLVADSQMKKPLTPLLRNGHPWAVTDE